MGSAHNKLLLQTEKCEWPFDSQDNVCQLTFFALFRSLDISHWHYIILYRLFADELWICRQAYLANTFCLLYELNKIFQRYHTMLFSICNKTKALRKKVSVAINYLISKTLSWWRPQLERSMAENKILQICPQLALLNTIKSAKTEAQKTGEIFCLDKFHFCRFFHISFRSVSWWYMKI